MTTPTQDHTPAPSSGKEGIVQPKTVSRALVDQQSVQVCTVCHRSPRYCATDGQTCGKHAFTPRVTCESCVHMGRQYHGEHHFCGRSDERRAAAFKPSGDFAHDFMSEFRKFYDASLAQVNCGRWFEAKATAAEG